MPGFAVLSSFNMLGFIIRIIVKLRSLFSLESQVLCLDLDVIGFSGFLAFLEENSGVKEKDA